MLAEMTRAFNGGFGLGAHGITGASVSRNNNQVGENLPFYLMRTILSTIHSLSFLWSLALFKMQLQAERAPPVQCCPLLA